MESSTINGRREYGDWQTPPSFAEKVCRRVRSVLDGRPSVVVEPTCGAGNFLRSALVFDAPQYIGVEISPDHFARCGKTVQDGRVELFNGDIFAFDLRSRVADPSRALVIGNPPWATTSALGALGSSNLPKKANFKNLKGLEAVTGSGGFDICEAVILKAAREFGGTDAVIAMLCKAATARSVFKELKRAGASFSFFEMWEFDAGAVFGVDAAACVLVLKLSKSPATVDQCHVRPLDDPDAQGRLLRWEGGELRREWGPSVPDLRGGCCLRWRQGVKHDCARVMELALSGGSLVNGFGETVRIEGDYVYPLAKGGAFKAPVLRGFSKRVIVTQKTINEDTSTIASAAPRTWAYLNRHKALLDGRRSAVYRKAPPFAMFGVGEYSYAPFKVGIGGLNKKPFFSLLADEGGRPVMADDTCYFICFQTFEAAYVALLVLDSPPVLEFLSSLAFEDSKRPFSKRTLDLLSFRKAFPRLDLGRLRETERALGLEPFVDSRMYEAFKALPEFARAPVG